MAGSHEERLRQQSEEIMRGLDISGMDEGFVAIHELFLSIKKGGFTKSEALWIISYMVCGGASSAIGGEDEPDEPTG
jgi:hypothetical protein